MGQSRRKFNDWIKGEGLEHSRYHGVLLIGYLRHIRIYHGDYIFDNRRLSHDDEDEDEDQDEIDDDNDNDDADWEPAVWDSIKFPLTIQP